MVWRMIRRNCVNGSIAHSIQQSLNVISASQRWAHLHISVIGFDCFISKCPMMRGNFTGYAQSCPLRLPYCFHRAAGRSVRDVQPSAGNASQQAVACGINFFGGGGHASQPENHGPAAFVHHSTLTQRKILTMINEWKIEAPGIFHCASHHSSPSHWTPIV